MALKIRAEVSPRKGSVPVHISYRTAPKENRSVRASSSLPANLLRRHIGHGAQSAAGTGEMFLEESMVAAPQGNALQA